SGSGGSAPGAHPPWAGEGGLSGGATWGTSGHEGRLTTIPDPTATDPLVLLRHIWAGSERVPTEAAGTSLKAASQGCRKPSPHACDRVRHVALRPDRGRRAVDNRREGQTSRVGGLHAVLRGEASSARQQGTHKPRCTRW